MKKNVLLCFFILISLVIFPSPVLALKKRVWRSTPVATTATGSPSVGAKLSADRQNIIITFRNVTATNSISYELTYTGNDNEQGIFGSVKPSEGNTVVRTLYFGTCSKNACTPHRNLKNGTLTITNYQKTGNTLAKRYRIKL